MEICEERLQHQVKKFAGILRGFIQCLHDRFWVCFQRAGNGVHQLDQSVCDFEISKLRQWQGCAIDLVGSSFRGDLQISMTILPYPLLPFLHT